VRHAAGFQDEGDWLQAADVGSELVAGQALTHGDLPSFVGHGHLEHILGEIDGDESMIGHGWTPLV
jgi:hypothetical protein